MKEGTETTPSGSPLSGGRDQDGREVVLGVDPSLRGTGWGVLESEGGRFKVGGFGVVKNPPGLRPSQCLVRIREVLAEVIRSRQPTVMAVEGLYFAQNMRTAFVMGHARGAVLLAGAEAGLDIYEYAPRRVKQSTVGVGGAAKKQVGFMVRAVLSLTETPPPDAADALAIALTHLNMRRSIAERVAL
ncbi:MAG: crossover junction endodeoxyribonuclease RuvC [Verrucomicrobiae bacterium]|nr:crossover junction endodeoxyribonuclease RuvC [Verrucomicrobiae bacterium]